MRGLRIHGAHGLALLALALVSLLPSLAAAGTCGVLPFSADDGVGRGAADNIASLISSELDIQGDYDLVLAATRDDISDDCGSDPACIIKFAKTEGHVQVVSGHVADLGADEFQITARLHDGKSGRVVRAAELVTASKADVLLDTLPGLVVELATGKKPEKETAAEEKKGPLFDDVAFEDEAEDSPDWMKRDRQGRRIRKAGAEEEPDVLGLDELEDENLDLDVSAEDERRRQAERAAKEAEERERREAAAARERDDRRRQEQAERERAEAQAERDRERRAEEDRRDRERRDEERRVEEERLEKERWADERRAEERRAEEDRRERAREAEARKAEEARREEAKRQAERERREAEARADDERHERERREAEAQAEAERRERDRRTAATDSRGREKVDRREEPPPADGGELALGSPLSLGSGLIMVSEDDEAAGGFVIEDEEGPGFVIEDEEGPGFVIEDAEPADDDSYEDDYVEPEVVERDELEPGQIIGDEEGRPTGGRRRSRTDRDSSDDRYASARSWREDEDPDRADDRDYDRDDRDRRDDRARDYDRDDRDDEDIDFDEEPSRSNYNRGRSRSTGRTKVDEGKRQWVSIRGGVGYTNYYLHFAQYGLELGVFPLPMLSVDLGADFWSVGLTEVDPDGNERQVVRTLPSFNVGASYRGNFHRVVRPFAGAEFHTVMYAQVKLIDSQGNERIRPLFTAGANIKGGADFMFLRWLGASVGLKGGFAYAKDIQAAVPGVDWAPVAFVFNARAAVILMF